MRPTPNIKQLGITLEKEDLWNDLGLLPRVQRLILGSQNLTSLDMKILGGGCVSHDPFEFETWIPGQFSPLEELTLRGYTFTEAGADYMWNSMDWRHLRTLHIGEECDFKPFLNRMISSLPSLETLHLVIPVHYDQPSTTSSINRFISLLPSLEELRIDGKYRELLQGIVEVHGPNLKRLKLHEDEYPLDEVNYPNLRHMLTREELMMIGKGFPQLETLSLDFNPQLGVEKWVSV